MGDLRSRIEVTKLARELGVEESEISFLTASAPEDLRELRRLTSTARCTRTRPATTAKPGPSAAASRALGGDAGFHSASSRSRRIARQSARS